MKSASTTAQTEALLYQIDYAGRSVPIAKVQYYGDDLAWHDFDDVESVSVSFGNQTKIYTKFVLVPPSSSCSVKLQNKNAQYSPGSGTAFDGVLIRNRLIRVYMGYTVNGTDELFLQGEYLLDTPSFNSALANYDASFTARDRLKKAFENKVSCPAYSGDDVAVVIRDIADRAGLPHNDGGELIPDTGSTVTIGNTLTFAGVKAIDALNECMIYLNQVNNNYRLELNTDGFLQLVIKSIDNNDADYQLDYRYNLFSASKKYESSQLLQRVTILSKDTTASQESELDSATYNTAGQKTLSWTNPSVFKRLSIAEGGTNAAAVDVVEVNNDSLVINITGTPVDITATVYGDELPGSYTGYAGEAIYWANAEEFDGQTQKLVIRLAQSDAEAKAIAESLIAVFGNPDFNISTNNSPNPLLELGDRVLIWEKFTLSNSIYRIDNINLSYSAGNAKLTQSLSLTDLGIDITNFNWDRQNVINGGTEPGAADFNYDAGILWDQDLGFNQDTTDYDTTIPVRFS